MWYWAIGAVGQLVGCLFEPTIARHFHMAQDPEKCQCNFSFFLVQIFCFDKDWFYSSNIEIKIWLNQAHKICFHLMLQNIVTMMIIFS